MSKFTETKSWIGSASIEEVRNQVVLEMKKIQTAFTRKFGINTKQRHISAWKGGTIIRPCAEKDSNNQDFQNINDDVSEVISMAQETININKIKKDLEKSRDIISNLPLPNTDDIEQNIREELKLNNDKIKQNEKEYPYTAPIGTQTKNEENKSDIFVETKVILEPLGEEEENKEKDNKEDNKKNNEEENDEEIKIDKKEENKEENEEEDNETLGYPELSDNIVDIDGLLKYKSSDIKKLSNEKLQTEMKKVERGNVQLKEQIINKLFTISNNFTNTVSIKSLLDEDTITKSLTKKQGGGNKKPADELYNQVVFTKGGGIKKLNLKRSKYKKKINKIVDNLINILNQSGGSMKELRAKQKQDDQKNFERNKVNQDWQGKISLLKKYREALVNINEYIEFYAKNIHYYELDKKDTSNSDITTYNFSMGELANYESIMRNILDLWKIFGLVDIDDEIFNDLQKLFDQISDIEESNKTLAKKHIAIDALFENIIAKQLLGLKALRFFGKPEYMIKLRWEDEPKIEELKSRMVHMNNNKIKELIELLKKLYKEHYLMIVRYQKLFSQIKANKNVQAIDSIIIVREGGTELQKDFLKFFVIRDILDDYLVLTRRPVSIYARINDIGRFQKKRVKHGFKILMLLNKLVTQ